MPSTSLMAPDGLAAGVSGIAALTLYIVVIRRQDDIVYCSFFSWLSSGFFHIILIPQNIHGDTGATF